MLLLSIILPVYNVEKYLANCLDSLLNQDISSNTYEIIIVNDGSTDKSFSIAQYYVDTTANVFLLNQTNKGLGGARNVGLRAARGKYLFFVDSDDYVQEKCLNRLLRVMDSMNLDVLRFNYQMIDENNGCVIPKSKNAIYAIDFSNDVTDGATFLSERLGWACYVWQFIFKKELLINSNILFDEGLYLEDLEWLPQILLKAQRISSINKDVYFYLQRENSITKSVDLNRKRKLLNDKLIILDKYIGWKENVRENSLLSRWYLAQITLSVMWLISYIDNNFTESELTETIVCLKNRKIFPLKTYRFTFSQKVSTLLLNISPRLYCSIKNRG